jgi:imidazoleglycerol phosphate synthase glutamine amidotransferase subunit HisH
MRKITQDAINAFYNLQPFARDNTMVQILNNGEPDLMLHGHTIATMQDNQLFISSCGWNTTTTKERLNGLEGVRIYQKNYEWYLNGYKWEGNKVNVKVWTDHNNAINNNITK